MLRFLGGNPLIKKDTVHVNHQQSTKYYYLLLVTLLKGDQKGEREDGTRFKKW
jgi:hypothetical protein